MNKCILEEECNLSSSSNQMEIMLKNINDEVKRLVESTEAKLLLHDGKIAEMCKYIKDNLSNTIRDLIDSMKLSGEVSEIVNDSINDFLNQIYNMYQYYDEITYQEIRDNDLNTTYYITTVPHTDKDGNIIKLKLGIANDNENLDSLESTLSFAHRKNTSLCINGGIADTSDKAMGTVIKDGKVLKNVMYKKEFDILGIKEDNGLLSFRSDITTSSEILTKCNNALMGFYMIIKNGVVFRKEDDNFTKKNPRQVICELTNKDIMILTCDGRNTLESGLTGQEVINILSNYPVKNAYMLDGGGSTSTVIKGSKINKNIDNYGEKDRKVATFIYVSRNENESIISDIYNKIGELRNELIGRIDSLVDITSGYLNLYARDNELYPGISYYPDGKKIRAGKTILNYTHGFYATHRETVESEEKTVIQANSKGISDVEGLLANFKDFAIMLDDCNKTDIRSGLYRVNNATLNKAEKITSGFLLHLKYDNTYIKQILIPATDDIIYFRRFSNTWSDWSVFNVSRGSTENRPTNPIQGSMYFDSTLGKPIWYGGGTWLDSNGNPV